MAKNNPGSGDGNQKAKRKKGGAGNEYSVDNLDDDLDIEDADNDTDDDDNTDDKKTFTQEELNRIVKDRLKKEKAKTDKAIKEKKALLERLKDSESTSQEDREDLQAQITALEEANMSEKELAEKRVQDATKKREGELKAEREEKERLHNLLVRNEKRSVLMEAAGKHNAFDPGQVFGLLSDKLVVEELKDDVSGRPTGKFSHKLILPVEQEDGTFDEQEFSIGEGVKTYLELNPNLIKDNFADGGAGSEVGTVNTDGERIVKESDIANMSDEDFENHLDDLLQANADGRVAIGK